MPRDPHLVSRELEDTWHSDNIFGLTVGLARHVGLAQHQVDPIFGFGVSRDSATCAAHSAPHPSTRAGRAGRAPFAS